MGAPKEVFFVERQDGSGFATLDPLGHDQRVGMRLHRYVLARPKREAVAWVVKREVALRYLGHFEWDHLRYARRFRTRFEAQAAADEAIKNNTGVRVVKLVRPVKP